MRSSLGDIFSLLIDIEFFFGALIQQFVLLKWPFAFTLGSIFFRGVRIDNRLFFDRLSVGVIDWLFGTKDGLFGDFLSWCDIERWLERFLFT